LKDDKTRNRRTGEGRRKEDKICSMYRK